MTHTLRHILTILLPLAAMTANAAADPWFDDAFLRDHITGQHKPVMIEDQADYFFTQGEDKITYHNDPKYGSLTFERLKNRRALVGEHCTVNKLITEVGLGNWNKDLGNMIDEDLDNYAEFNKVVGVGATVNPIVAVKDMSRYYAKGTEAGFCIVASSGNAVLTLDVVRAMSIGFYRDGEEVGMLPVQEGMDAGGLTLSLIQIPGSEEACTMLTCKSDWVFDEIVLDATGGVTVSVGDLLKVKYAFVGKSDQLTMTYGGVQRYNQGDGDDIAFDEVKGWNPVLLGIPFPFVHAEVEKMKDDNLDNYATITPILAIGYRGGAKFMMKNTTHPDREAFEAGSDVGFKYKMGAGLALDAGAWIRLILFDRNGNKVQEETIKAEVLNLTLAQAGDGTSSVTAKVPFSGCEIRFHTVLSLDLGAMGIHYGFVKRKPDVDHHCDMRPSPTLNVCEDYHECQLTSNTAVPCTWDFAYDQDGMPMMPADAGDVTVTQDGYVSGLSVAGEYKFVCTSAIDGVCTDTCLVRYNLFGENAAIGPDGKINPTGCARPLATGWDVGDYEASDRIYDSSGSLLSASSIKNKEYIADRNLNNYADYTGGLSIASNLCIIGLKRTDGQYMFDASRGDTEKRIGFLVEADVTGLDLSALQFLQIRCYDNTIADDDAKEQWRGVISENNAVSAGLAGSDQMMKVRYSVEVPLATKNGRPLKFNEFQLWTSGVLNLGASHLKIYYGFIEEKSSDCSDPLGCGAQMLSHDKTHTTLNGNATTYGDAISVARTVNEISRLLDGNPNTKMTIANPVNAGGLTIAINLGRTCDARHQLGIITDNKTYLANVKVGNWIKAMLYYKGNPTGDELTDWSVLGADVAGSGDKNFLYITPKRTFDEVRLEFGGVVTALDVQNYYGLFIRGDADGDGLPDCQDIQSCPLVVKESPVCLGQQVYLTIAGTQKHQLYATHHYNLYTDEPGVEQEPAKWQNQQLDHASHKIVHNHTATTVGSKWTFTVYDIEGDSIAAQVHYSVHPKLTHWKKEALSSDWTSWANWEEGVPHCCSDVVIPSGAANYPSLPANSSAAVAVNDPSLANYCCDNIIFEPGGRVDNTTELNYRRAYVNFELPCNGYHLIAAPLKNVYTGDMFIPRDPAGRYTANYTEIFSPDGQLNETTAPENRFNPSIYQRFYGSAVPGAEVSLSSSSAAEPTHDAALSATQTNWTHNFNTVGQKLAMGRPTSIWVDNGNLSPDSVFLFRLPKLHSKYYYYSDYDSTRIDSKETPITRTDAAGDNQTEPGSYRFIYEHSDNSNLSRRYQYNCFMDGVAETDKYSEDRCVYNQMEAYTVQLVTDDNNPASTFLFGNPLMGNIYLSRFFTDNSDVREVEVDCGGSLHKMTRGGYATADITALPPMAGMFVTYSTPRNEADIRITPAMLTPDRPTTLTRRAPQAAANRTAEPTLRLTLAHKAASRTAGSLFIQTDDETTASAALFDSEWAPQLAIFGLQTAQDGQTPRACDIMPVAAAETPLGIVAPDTATVSLTVHTDGGFPRDSYYILDRATSQRYTLDDDITLTQCGTSIGRYVLVCGDIHTPTAIAAPEAPAAEPIITVRHRVATVEAPGRAILSLACYDTAGRKTAEVTGCNDIPLPAGLTILRVRFQDGTSRSYKLH